MSGLRLPKSKEVKYGLYPAGPDGFTEEGRIYHRDVVLPRLATLDGATVHTPWVNLLRVPEAEIRTNITGLTHEQALEIGRANFRRIDSSAVILANLNGPDPDSGTCIEVGYGYAKGKLVVGYRTDLRKSGETGVTVNLQVQSAIEESGGKIFASLDDAIAFIRDRMPEVLVGPTPPKRGNAANGLYPAGPDGFTEEGRIYHRAVVLPKLATLQGVEVKSPWAELLKMGEGEIIAEATRLTYNQAMGYGRANFGMIDSSRIILANLNGTDSDSGTCVEVGYGYAQGKLVVGYRTDYQASGNSYLPGIHMNLQIHTAVEDSGGMVFTNFDESVEFIRARIVEMKRP